MKLKTLLVILALVAAVAFVLSDFYKDRAKESSLREIEAREKLSKADLALAKKNNANIEARAEAKIAELQGNLDSNAKYISNLEASKIDNDRNLVALRESWKGLDLVCQGKLKELDEAWGKNLTIANQEIAVLKESNALLGQQRIEDAKIIASLHVALSAADDRIKGLEATVATIAGKYIRARNAGYLKTAAVVAIAALAVIT